MTAEEAKKPENESEVRSQLAIHAKHDRKHPDLDIGDKVFLYKKKKAFVKERVSTWEDGSRKVVDIDVAHGQTYYKLSGKDQSYEWYVRSNIHRLPEEQQDRHD